MRLEYAITLSKGVATIKEITPTDFVLAIQLAIARYGDISIDDVEQDFWQTVWLDQGLIALDGEFTEAEFVTVMGRFSELNQSLFQKQESGHVDNTPSSKVNKKLSRVAQEIQTECAIFVSLHNYQSVFSYGFMFIRQIQKLHKK